MLSKSDLQKRRQKVMLKSCVQKWRLKATSKKDCQKWLAKSNGQKLHIERSSGLSNKVFL